MIATLIEIQRTPMTRLSGPQKIATLLKKTSTVDKLTKILEN
jgi:hypothetical protein